MRLYEAVKELGVEYKDIYEAVDELGIELKKRHPQTTLAEEDLDSLRDYFDVGTSNEEKPQKNTSKKRKSKKPKLISDGEIIINAEIKDTKDNETKAGFEDDIDELELIEEETGRKFSKEERHRRQSLKKKKEPGFSPLDSKKDKNKSEDKKEEIVEEAKKVQLPELMSLQDFSSKINVGQNEIIKKLMMLGVTNAAQPLDFDVASIIAEDFGYETELIECKEDVCEPAIKSQLQERPPVVTIMGHVDHGKTTLLDNIRKANVAAREAGGITQHIGAYQIIWKKQKITFIDTPGHEAFTEMRAQGANATDIAIIVVAADDGMKPQTREAIDHAKAAEVPIIVAINKIDRPGANPEKIKQELANVNLVPESWGGDTICVEISAKMGTNIEELLEMILLVSEMEELKAEYDIPAQGIIIESYKHKAKGPLATVIIQKGILHKSNIVVSGIAYGKVKAMFDEYGKRVERAEPSKPVEIMGFSEVPNVGDKFKVVSNEKLAREIVQKHTEKRKIAKSGNKNKTLEELLSQVAGEEKKKLNIILKTDVKGTSIALKESLEKISDDEIDVAVIHTGVGIISETDVNLAVASNAIIIGFNIRETSNAKKLAEQEGIEIRTYKIIYEAIEDIANIVKGMWAAVYKDQVIGQASVLTTFKVPKIGIIAGCKVDNGVVKRKCKVKVIRDGQEIYESKLSSLKRFKDDVQEVQTGYECGIGVENYNDLKEGDILEIIEEVEEER